MIIYPAIDLYNGQAVRLLQGRYEDVTVYSTQPQEVAASFFEAGADHLHLVDLNGAKDGTTPNFGTVMKIVETVNTLADLSGRKHMFVEIGGGIRSFQTAEAYLNAGCDRVILGTAAVEDEALLKSLVERFGDAIAVGADLRNGEVAIKGWTESSGITMDDFFEKMVNWKIRTVICTDISKDGAMEGTSLSLYRHIRERYGIELIASGGVTDLMDVFRLKELGVEGAIIGKALYSGKLDLKQAIEAAK